MNLDARILNASFKDTPYKILEKIGEGGFGQVFKAEHKTTHQKVAIKLLNVDKDLSEDKKGQHIKRFEHEAKLVGMLNHPNIIRLQDKGQAGHLRYVVFEYVHGKSLKTHLANVKVLSPSEAGSIMGSILDALIHAHKRGVVHRDIKPANIMLLNTGVKTHVKILDFGISTTINSSHQKKGQTPTFTHETVGTPAYSAPEQLRGARPTHKIDLYIWGLVFIECLTGQQAVTGSSIAAIFHQQLSSEPISLPQSIVGHPLCTVLKKALHKNPHKRIRSARALYYELAQVNLKTLAIPTGIISNNLSQKNNSKTHKHEFSVQNNLKSNTCFYSSFQDPEKTHVISLNVTPTTNTPPNIIFTKITRLVIKSLFWRYTHKENRLDYSVNTQRPSTNIHFRS